MSYIGSWVSLGADRKTLKKDKFLKKMDKVISWQELINLITPYYGETKLKIMIQLKLMNCYIKKNSLYDEIKHTIVMVGKDNVERNELHIKYIYLGKNGGLVYIGKNGGLVYRIHNFLIA